MIDDFDAEEWEPAETWDCEGDDEDLEMHDEAWEIALNDHPEYRRGVEEGSLPDEVMDEHGVVINPRLHLEMHAIIERQLAADEPEGVVEIARELEEEGVTRHEIRHVLAEPLVGQIWEMLQGSGREFDERRYLRELRTIIRKRFN